MANQKLDIEIFADHCVFMRSVYLHGKILFENSTADDKARTERAAQVFFGDLNRILIEYMILQVCKITDPAQDFRKNDNHTVEYLLQHYDFSDDPDTLNRLQQMNTNLMAFRVKLLPARNKLISHSDRNSILDAFALGATSDAEWEQFWLDLQDVVRIVHQKAVGGPPFNINSVGMLSDADGLLKALKHSAHFDELLNGNDRAISAKCVELALG